MQAEIYGGSIDHSFIGAILRQSGYEMTFREMENQWSSPQLPMIGEYCNVKMQSRSG